MSLFGWFKNIAEEKPLAPQSSALSSSSATATVGAIHENKTIHGLDFVSAIEAHRNWKIRLKDYINGVSHEHLDHTVICRDNQCALGKWIHSDAAVFVSHLPAFHELKTTHAKFHLAAGEIVEAVSKNQKDKALNLLNEGEYNTHSSRTQTQIARLFVQING